jgi:uncharacterized protein (TIGR02466 family)
MTMFGSPSPQPIFPTHIWVHDLGPDVAAPMNQRLADMLDKLTRPRPQLPPGNNWQTDQTLHKVPEFGELMSAFLAASAEILTKLDVVYSGIEISGCWANVSPKGAIHLPHHHPNNYLSGIYYVHTTEGADRVTFYDPSQINDVLAPQLRAANKYNYKEYTIPAKPGRLVIFPSWLTHSVPENTSDQFRISISFNIVFSDFAKTVAIPKWDGLPLNLDALRSGEN